MNTKKFVKDTHYLLYASIFEYLLVIQMLELAFDDYFMLTRTRFKKSFKTMKGFDASAFSDRFLLTENYTLGKKIQLFKSVSTNKRLFGRFTRFNSERNKIIHKELRLFYNEHGFFFNSRPGLKDLERFNRIFGKKAKYFIKQCRTGLSLYQNLIKEMRRK